MALMGNDGTELRSIVGIDSTTPAQESRAPETIDGSFDREQAELLAKKSPDFLSALAMPTVFEYFWPSTYISIWLWLTTKATEFRTFPKLALGLPRGFGKTTFIKIFILYLILFTNKKFIAIFGATEEKAVNILTDIMDMLSEPNMVAVFGDWRIGVEKDTATVKKFGFRGRDIILVAKGAGGSFRGMNLKNERPDVILFDDIQEREEADSALVSDKLEKWMYGTAMKAKSPKGCMTLFIGNMYPTDWSLLKRIKHNPTWLKMIVGGILEDGTSLWEDLQPIGQLMEELQSDLAAGRADIFFAEVLNDEYASANTLLDLSKLPPCPNQPGDVHYGNFVIIDPAAKTTTGHDETSLGYFEIYGEARPVLMKLDCGLYSPLETISRAINFCLQNNCYVVLIEGTAYQSTLGYWAKFICQQRGIEGIQFLEIFPKGGAKTQRIVNWLRGYAKGESFVDNSCRPEVHMQISRFNPLRRDNVDGILDLMTYANQAIAENGPLISARGNIIDSQNFGSLGVVDDNCTYAEN